MKLYQFLKRFIRPNIVALIMRGWASNYRVPFSGIWEMSVHIEQDSPSQNITAFSHVCTKQTKKINPRLLLVGLTLNDYCFHSRSLTFKIFRGACRQLLTQHVLALSKTAHVSSQPDPAFKIFLTKIRLHCTWVFLCVQSWSLVILITKLFFFQVFVFVWRQVSGGCQMHLSVAQKA